MMKAREHCEQDILRFYCIKKVIYRHIKELNKRNIDNHVLTDRLKMRADGLKTPNKLDLPDAKKAKDASETYKKQLNKFASLATQESLVTALSDLCITINSHTTNRSERKFRNTLASALKDLLRDGNLGAIS